MTHIAWRKGIVQYQPSFYDWYMLTKYPNG